MILEEVGKDYGRMEKGKGSQCGKSVAMGRKEVKRIPRSRVVCWGCGSGLEAGGNKRGSYFDVDGECGLAAHIRHLQILSGPDSDRGLKI